MSHLVSGLPRQMTAFDPAMGRGYRIGDQVLVPAYAGVVPPPGFVAIPPTGILVHGAPNVISRWKITLHTAVPAGVVEPARDGSHLRFVVLAQMENETIPRRCAVTVGDSQVVYAPGRTISVFGFNPTGIPLEAHYSLDEVTAGLARWEDSEFFPALVAETDLDVPPFIQGFEVFQVTPIVAADAAPSVRAYGPGGALVYHETFVAARSGFISRIPGADYTIASANPPKPARCSVLYTCDG